MHLCIVNAATESPCSPHASFIPTIPALGIRIACSFTAQPRSIALMKMTIDADSHSAPDCP